MRPSTDLLWERWEEVDRILAGALELPADRREAYVRCAAGRDRNLRDLVLRLVGHADRRRDLATGPDERVVAAAFGGNGGGDAPMDIATGASIDRYVILRHRARGGMASVYEAERSDGVYRQRVALKVLRPGLDTADLIQRFRTERQILSSLSHPNIARLLDGGATQEGRPYLVMELVDGEPITMYADTRRLDVDARLRLFLAVAEAVHAAHQQLVVHRDIKPSNILVDRDGRVKLLDFGIAKLLAGSGEHTDRGVRALTPDYASPEQLRGDPITTATDVYQLGLLLRELLTGVRPAAGDTQPGEPPLRPSRAAAQPMRRSAPPESRAADRRTTPPRLARRLRGDLDIIVGKALRPEPSQRYPSADELAADVTRHLDGLPILAHPESAAYRAGKFVRRNAWSVGSAAVALVLLIAYAITATAQGRRIAAAGALAEQEARAATQVTEFLVQLFQSGNPTVALSDTVTVGGLLEAGVARVDSALAGQPAVRARMLLALGRAFTGLGRHDRADTLLRRAVTIQREVHGPDHPRVADVLGAMGANFRGERDFRRADSAYSEELRSRSAGGAVADTTLARMLANLAHTRRDLQDVDSAVKLARRAVELRRSAGDTTGESFLGALGTLAYVLRAAGSLDSAETIYRELIRLRAGRDDDGLAALRNNLGFLLRTRGDYVGAEAEYREAVRITRKVLGPGHPTSLMVSSNLASALELQGKLQEVESIGRERIAAAEREWPGGHWRVGAAHSALGLFLLRHGRPADARGPLGAAVAMYTRTIGTDHTWTAAARVSHGAALLLAGRPAEGDRLVDAGYALLRTPLARLDGDTRFNLGRVAGVLESHGHQSRAARLRELTAAPDSLAVKP